MFYDQMASKIQMSLPMDPIWRTLPLELAERICNMLPNVRSISRAMKMEIESQRHLYAKLYNQYLYRNNYVAHWARRALREDIGGRPEDIWNAMSPHKRLTFYDRFGPRYTDEVEDNREAWETWIEETRY
jgi:hypothetical protein